jgi:hypothetical protein
MLVPVEGLIEVLMVDTDPTFALTARDGQGALVELNLVVDKTDVGKAFLLLDTRGPENPRAREAMSLLTSGVQMVFRGPVLFQVAKDETVFDLLKLLSS